MYGNGLIMKHDGKRVLAIGPLVKHKRKHFSGQAMLFQLFVDELNKRNICNTVIDISGRFSSLKVKISGRISLLRIIDYIIVINEVFFNLIFHRKNIIYLTTSQSFPGFIRDYLIISTVNNFSDRIVCHQFGANYGRFYKSQYSFVQNMLKKMYKMVDIIIVEGDQVKDDFYFVDDHISKVKVVPNGLPQQHHDFPKEGKNFSGDTNFNLLYLSNLIESKGYLDVLEAVNILVNKRKKNVNCTFIGRFLTSIDDKKYELSDAYKNHFFSYIKKNKLEDNVEWIEGVYGDTKREYFQQSHVFLLPSNYVNEGQPISVLEAMAYGLVPVVTKYRLIPNMVKSNNGIFVEYNSPEQISEKCELLMNDKKLFSELSLQNIKYFNNHFTYDIYSNNLLDLVFTS